MSYFSVIESDSDIVLKDILEDQVVGRWRKGLHQYYFDVDYDDIFNEFLFNFVDTNDYVPPMNKYTCFHDCLKNFERLKRDLICLSFIKEVIKEIDLRLIQFEEG